MRLSTLCMASLLAVGAVGVAHATPLVSNGDFSQITTPNAGCNQASGTPTQIGSAYHCGQFVTGWTAKNYAIWYPSNTAASTVQADTTYGMTGNQFLPAAVTAPPTGPGTFIGLDGQSGSVRASISQTINGLTAGAKYTVSFYWASTQEMSRTGATTEQLAVSLGGSAAQYTAINSIVSHGWEDWVQQTMVFTAGSTSELLNFLSIGTPSGEPPFALLSNVSMTQNVPEPSDLAMFGGGLFGLGLLVMLARRREMRRRDANGSNAIV